jgi:exopolyphosphatase/guanosine-5'-triphosphate,3'-diphosphate pyrophosphatase
MRRAILDIGTNSVKLLVAEVEGRSVVPLYEKSEQTRLGQGFYPEHRLQASAIHHTARAVARFSAEAHRWNVITLRAIATSAVRDATNREELLDAVRATAGLEIQVISGEQEADWVFAGVLTDPKLAGRSLLIMDVGGGSTEFILGQGEQPIFRKSFPLGTVRLLEQVRPADPPQVKDWEKCQRFLDDALLHQVEPSLRPHLISLESAAPQLVGTGGTTSILAAMEAGLNSFDRDRFERTELRREKLRACQQRLWSLPLAQRQGIPGLPANRADVILFGVAVFAGVMEVFGFEQVQVSTRGLRFAAVAQT